MGMRHTLRIYKGSTLEMFRGAMEETAKAVGGVLVWGRNDENYMRLGSMDDVHTVYISFRSGAEYAFCYELGKRLGVPWMELRIQEGSHWDYALYDGGVCVDNFSTFPQYWEDMENPD